MTAQSQSRYHRQELIAGIGRAGQQRMRDAHALVVGCGALGCAVADILARAGIGRLTIVDRDIVEVTNLQRQSLFTERDAVEGIPKAEAAKRRICEINSQVECRGWVEHVGPDNVISYASDADIILDGLDNLHTRFLLNDAAVSLGKPYLYGGAVATRGMSMPILPGEACLRCIFSEPAHLQTGETCDTAGVLMSAVVAVSAHQALQAIKWIVGANDAIDRSLWSIETWGNRENRVSLAGAKVATCSCCAKRDFEYLSGRHEDQATVLCGRGAVQVAPRGIEGTVRRIDLAKVAIMLAPHGSFGMRGGLLVGTLRGVQSPEGNAIELTIFPDGRAIIGGSIDETFARGIYDRFIGGS